MTTQSLDPNKWINSYADFLFNYTITRVRDEETAKDLIQETFLSALKAAPNFRGEATEKTWLTSILKRKIIDYYRKINNPKHKAIVRFHNTQRESSNSSNWLEERYEDRTNISGDVKLEAQEFETLVFENIAKLPKKQNKALTMKTIQKMSTEDICNELDITVDNFWVTIHRARKRLMLEINKEWHH
ncbi:sigma-70 family RNA polymerase sigma factor [uncultured Dokdonia sp.]|uniref:RNA polymerase sigma factor n=1 Tax=uncultured Dokdonia sp. TaxID=575653 RepID=UPI0026236E53|nr:sigma-70 family RNA polymerase sigma factor [uncultured Dokdonia sp.]